MENKVEFNKPSMLEMRGKVNKNVTRVIKGSIFAIVVTLILLFIYACLLTFTSLSETTMTPVIITIAGISILIGSSISSLKIKKQGMLNGALVGLIYMILIYLISSIFLTGFDMNTKSIIMIIVGTIAGMIGGIIGVNL